VRTREAAGFKSGRSDRRIPGVEYSYITTDADGKDEIVARGQYDEGTGTPDVGETVTLAGVDGVERSWRVVRKIPVAYAGQRIFVEPLELS